MRLNYNVSLKSDTKQWDRMERRLLGGNKTVDIGWWGTRHHSGETTAQIAAWNEEGHMNGGIFAGTITPPRPFIRTGFLPDAKKSIENYYPKIHLIAMGKLSWTAFYKRMAEDYVILMQETILKWNRPPNSPVTISMKGFNDPLINTGNMYDAVKHRIVRYTKR